MWALRRTSIRFRNRGLATRVDRIFCAQTKIARCSEACYAGMLEQREKNLDGMVSATRFYSTSSSFLKSHMEIRTFASVADSKSSGENDDDLEDSFSDLETPEGDENDDDLSSGSELSKDEGMNQLEAFGSKTAAGEKRSFRGTASSAMTEAILASPAIPVNEVLDKWVGEGNEVTKREVSLTIVNLRNRRLFVKALQLLEWLESTNHTEFVINIHASRVDLIAKVHGLHEAENYLKQIPGSFRTAKAYESLLANCVHSINVKKAEEAFNKLKCLGFPATCFSYNQLLLLYKRTDRKKIADVLLLMDKKNVKPSIFTYQILIDVKGQANDISGMEQIVETMKAEGMESNSYIQTRLARYYAASGKKEKAEAVLKEMEGADIQEKRWACKLLIPIYASIGRADEVDRIWKACGSTPRVAECLAAIEAWGQLKKIEKAEAAFDTLLKTATTPSSKHFASLLQVYVDHKMLGKGKDLVKRMGESGCMLCPLTWDAIMKLYVLSGKWRKRTPYSGRL